MTRSRWHPEACACVIAEEPCMENCSCANPLAGGGCLCCARYGSDEQRVAMAELIVETMRIMAQDDPSVPQRRPVKGVPGVGR